MIMMMKMIIIIVIIIIILTISKFSNLIGHQLTLTLTLPVIIQLYASCLSNWTVRVIKLALGSFSASSLEVEYINLSNSLYHCHILLKFCYICDFNLDSMCFLIGQKPIGCCAGKLIRNCCYLQSVIVL